MNKKFCGECGWELSSEDIFCPECGTKVFEDNKSNVEQVNVKTQSTPPPPPPSKKTEAENSDNYYTPPKESDTSAYYTPPIDKVQQESPVIKELTEDIDETYYSEEANEKEMVKEKSTEFDPFNQNPDAKTTAYSNHTRKTTNILFLIIGVLLFMLGIIFLVVLL